MKRLSLSVFSLACIFFVLRSSFADEDAAKGPAQAKAPNAAGIYWQAFATMPKLTNEEHTSIVEAIEAKTEPIGDETKEILSRFADSLDELNRAREVTPCDWQLDVDRGLDLLMPHVTKARDLSGVCLLRARERIASGDHVKALDDIIAVLKLGRDCASDPIVVSVLIGNIIERSAMEVAAAHLESLDRAQFTAFIKAYEELPTGNSMLQAVQKENAVVKKLLAAAQESGVPDAIESAERMEQFAPEYSVLRKRGNEYEVARRKFRETLETLRQQK